MTGDDTLIGAAKTILAKEVKANGLKSPKKDEQMISVPVWLLLVVVGGGGGGFYGASFLDEKEKEEASESQKALIIAQANQKELDARRSSFELIGVLDSRVNNVEDNQKIILEELGAIRREQREDFRALGELVKQNR